MHTMWKGSISFGLVNIPVKLFSATEDKDMKFRQLHKKCHTPIQYAKRCPNCDEEVGNDDIVKGFEYVQGKFIILTDEELAALKEENEDKTVEIVDFVNLPEIDPIYFNRSYYIGPGENGQKVYALLREALKQSGKIGIGKISMRSKQQLAVIRTYEDVILMETIHYPDEVRNARDVPGVPQNNNIEKKELDAAMLLIDQLTTTFKPEKYQDEYRLRIQEKIEQKVQQNETKTAEPSPKKNIVDLMSALEASIERSKSLNKKGEEKSGAAGKKTKTTRKKA
ncbi:Ku protein [Aeribacillus pallidus]|nr:Ku protein [Aeribacillus pallidus]